MISHCLYFRGLYLRGQLKEGQTPFGQLQNSQETTLILSGRRQYLSLEAPRNGELKGGAVEEADLLVTMETGPVSLKISLAQWAEVGSRAVQREAEDTARNGGAEWPH